MSHPTPPRGQPAALLLTVTLPTGRSSGAHPWPPAPARLLQALFEGGSAAGVPRAAAEGALRWLEALPPPSISAPRPNRGPRPGGAPAAEVVAAPTGPVAEGEAPAPRPPAPHHFDRSVPVRLGWALPEGAPALVDDLLALASGLAQLGRDPARAWAQLVPLRALGAHLRAPGAALWLPCVAEAGVLPLGAAVGLDCPQAGTTDSFAARFAAAQADPRSVAAGSAARPGPERPPALDLRVVPYSRDRLVGLYALRQPEGGEALVSWPLSAASALCLRVRDALFARLVEAAPTLEGALTRQLIGKAHAEGPALPAADRVRVLPVPGVGQPHADRALRRVAVELPINGLLDPHALLWALSGLALPNLGALAGAPPAALLQPEDDEAPLLRLGIGGPPARRWRSLTPLALPALSGPDDPAAAQRLADALRFALPDQPPPGLLHFGLQATPFGGLGPSVGGATDGGAAAPTFAEGSRFSPEALQHLDLELRRPVAGPLVLGDGRMAGLGLMVPALRPAGAWGWAVCGGLALPPAEVAVGGLTRALRRALMSRCQAVLGEAPLPTYVSGHQADAGPARDAPHLYFGALDGPQGLRLWVLAAHLVERRRPRADEQRALGLVDEALADLCELRAGSAGLLQLAPAEADDALFAPSRSVVSRSRYLVRRHRDAGGAAAAVEADVHDCLAGRGLPPATVEVEAVSAAPGRGLEATLRLRFASAVDGPVVIGGGCHLGQGWCAPAD
ncbi:MAG: type I-U CRISPR-associated protein Cas5/Cas6 [Deltaproteobacteria bacterium]|nr:type I-U CRISPR-associated protein Cas5/Cas6 [Deltaproteobacteria bacterium]